MRLVFHHIHKAGGGSFKESLKAAGFRWCKATFNENVQDMRAWMAKQPQEDAVYASHYLFRDYDGPLPYVTWIRDPVDMFYSCFHWCRKNGVSPYHKPKATREFLARVLMKHRDLESYVDDVLENDYQHVYPQGAFDLNWGRFDFIGVTGRPESIEAFNEKFGTSLELSHANRGPDTPKTYRRDEVAALFERESAIYAEMGGS